MLRVGMHVRMSPFTHVQHIVVCKSDNCGVLGVADNGNMIPIQNVIYVLLGVSELLDDSLSIFLAPRREYNDFKDL